MIYNEEVPQRHHLYNITRHGSYCYIRHILQTRHPVTGRKDAQAAREYVRNISEIYHAQGMLEGGPSLQAINNSDASESEGHRNKNQRILIGTVSVHPKETIILSHWSRKGTCYFNPMKSLYFSKLQWEYHQISWLLLSMKAFNTIPWVMDIKESSNFTCI